MSKKTSSILPPVAVVGIATLVAIGLWRSHMRTPVTVRVEPAGIMGTRCELMAVIPRERLEQAEEGLEQAEQRIRQVDALMSTYLDDSQISHFNAAPPGAPFPLAPGIMEVLAAARDVTEATDGAFDVTCYPLVKLWTAAGKEKRLPTDAQLAEARRPVGMRHLRFDHDGVTKLAEGVSVDLGAIAKGYAVDKAIEQLRKADLTGALVNIGGDLRCFGTNDQGRKWRVGIRHPFAPLAAGRTCGKMELSDAAVATSGDYFRFSEIDGRRYSHIVDPRTGWAVERRPSVTVVSLARGAQPASAMAADAWATALSVLGPEGLELLADQPGLEAMLVVGTPEKHTVHVSNGFESLLAPGTKIELD